MKESNLFDGIASFSALLDVSSQAAKGKRSKRDMVEFHVNLEHEILALECELRSEAYRPGRYRRTEVFDPKHRTVSAAPFRDRVVHYALHAVLGEIFERGFICDSYANRKGKSTHCAVRRNLKFRERFLCVLRCDIYRCFPAWCNCYRIRPVLLETFLERCFRGTCYRASKWVHIGQTKGRGKCSASTKPNLPTKDFWLYPLCRDFRHLLNS